MKSIWITGASSGIGYALAKRLAESGWQVLATARDRQRLQQLCMENCHIRAVPADLTCEQDIKRLAVIFANPEFRLDAVVVNAGTCEYMDNLTLDMASLQRVFALNVFAAAATIDLALPCLKQRKGTIVGVCSMSSYLPFTRAEYYGASKAAFSYYLKSLRVDLAGSGVSVCEVYPGFVQTPLTGKNDFPMPFMLTADEAAGHLHKVIDKRPRSYAFPRRLHYVLRLFGLLSPLWRYIHTPRVSSL